MGCPGECEWGKICSLGWVGGVGGSGLVSERVLAEAQHSSRVMLHFGQHTGDGFAM